MSVWIAASAAFFLYVIGTAPLVPRLTQRARSLAITGGLVGLLVTVAAHETSSNQLLHDWLLPPVLLLLGYWTSGCLFAGPMPRVEAVLLAIDRRLEIDPTARATPRLIAELLELAYAGVYLMVPLALLIHLAAAGAADPARFWTVILVTDFTCFACLPWIQTRPPRAISSPSPWNTASRRFNLRVLGKTSIQVNTFPSGHAAEAVAAALLVSAAPWPVVAAMGLGALLVSAGAVLGRYHYAADAFAGWAVAIIVWSVWS